MNYLWEWKNLFGYSVWWSADFLLLALDRYGFSLNCDFSTKTTFSWAAKVVSTVWFSCGLIECVVGCWLLFEVYNATVISNHQFTNWRLKHYQRLQCYGNQSITPSHHLQCQTLFSSKRNTLTCPLIYKAHQLHGFWVTLESWVFIGIILISVPFYNIQFAFSFYGGYSCSFAVPSSHTTNTVHYTPLLFCIILWVQWATWTN